MIKNKEETNEINKNKKIINLGIVAHVDAGKTTITENLLYMSGAIREIGRVDNGNTQTDSMEIERKRGISIKSTPISININGNKINIIDTPGHVEFVAEVERALSILDCAVLVISAKEGVQSHTRVLFKILKSLEIPTIIFVNKVDRLGVDCEELIKDIRELLSENIVKLQCIDKQGSREVKLGNILNDSEIMDEAIEKLCDIDESILERYLDREVIEKSYVINRIIQENNKCRLYPVFFGSALLGLGINEIFNYIPEMFSDNNKARKDLSGRVFKITHNSNGEKEIYVKIYDGELRVRDTINIHDSNRMFKVKRVKVLEEGRCIESHKIQKGDIGIIYGTDELMVGDILGYRSSGMKIASIAKPTIKTAVKCVNPRENVALYEALKRLSIEDPLLNLEIDDYTKKIYVSVLGEIQIDIIKEILEEQFGLMVIFDDVHTIYKEAPIGFGESIMPIYRGKNPFAAGVGIRVEPAERGAGIIYETEVSYGDLLKPFQNAVREAVYETCKCGLKGWEITDMKVTFFFSDYNSVDSTPADFRNLTPLALMRALKEAGTEILEPYCNFELKVPNEVSGKAMADIKFMRGTVLNILNINNEFEITGTIPSDTSQKYGTIVASYTEGRGIFTSDFFEYRKAPGEVCVEREKDKNHPFNEDMYLMYKMNVLK
ncbi:elongation factor G [Oceanirhabdus seepicola]|uniref:TetM/TetW/TetO/TetS family tetracycline resistance ribosomal protection protein n=1 Tax=Oceanirhabdus seepicola TaxID=2828781 RepID=A0A9J6P5N6_9CLOT|nr:TetM/TetW/TetO/TetS family tetracycline resistance ribosomal protection protein [Oceanirhabdus seepicola]MCM1992130.1 TetM/TetW/TetO/TetS family tetracycline resistance ribosomal protection protein [Oceanirhabdus seepicola]